MLQAIEEILQEYYKNTEPKDRNANLYLPENLLLKLDQDIKNKQKELGFLVEENSQQFKGDIKYAFINIDSPEYGILKVIHSKEKVIRLEFN